MQMKRNEQDASGQFAIRLDTNIAVIRTGENRNLTQSYDSYNPHSVGMA